MLKDTQTAGQALASKEFHHRVLQGKVNARASQKEAPSSHCSGAWGQHGRRDSETTVEERRPRTSPQSAPVRATARASTSRDSWGHQHRKVTGEETTLHNLPPRLWGTCTPGRPCSRRPSRPLPRGSVRGRLAGRPGGTPGTRGRPQRLAQPGVGDLGLAPSPRMPRAATAAGGAGDAGRGEGGLGTGRGPRAPRWLQAPSVPLAAPSGTAPRRTCHAPYLSGFVELLLEPGHRHGAVGRADGCECGGRKEAAAERDRRAEPGGALAGRQLVVPPPGLWARGRGETRDADSCGETP